MLLENSIDSSVGGISHEAGGCVRLRVKSSAALPSASFVAMNAAMAELVQVMDWDFGLLFERRTCSSCISLSQCGRKW